MRNDSSLDKAISKAKAGKHLDKSEIRRLKRAGFLQVSGCSQKFSLTKAGVRRAEAVAGDAR